MALAQASLQFRHGARDDEGFASAERALALNPDLAEAHCVMATYLRERGDQERANYEMETAHRLNPESWEVNKEMGLHLFLQGRFGEAVPYLQKAAEMVDTDYNAAGLLMCCFNALGQVEARRRAAELTRQRAEKAVAQDPSNGSALGYGAGSLAVLGETDRAKEWIQRALLIDPDNMTMRYNLACWMTAYLKHPEGALDLLEPYFAKAGELDVKYAKIDPDLLGVRDHPRFASMLAEADGRLMGGDVAKIGLERRG